MGMDSQEEKQLCGKTPLERIPVFKPKLMTFV
jgi:hypothetical protein